MSVKVSMQQLQNQLPKLLDQVVKNGEEYIVQRDGKDCAIIVSTRQWRRRRRGSNSTISAPPTACPAPNRRTEQLLAARQQRSLTVAERRELTSLLRECDTIMLRRAAALEPRP